MDAFEILAMLRAALEGLFVPPALNWPEQITEANHRKIPEQSASLSRSKADEDSDRDAKCRPANGKAQMKKGLGSRQRLHD